MADTQRDGIGVAGFRVEALSARTGAPVRTIREYQTWQILHPPKRVGRVGFYDESHVRRLEGIARLQARGYSIAAIRDLFDAWEQGAGLRDLLGVDDALGLTGDEAPMTFTAQQLGELLPAVAGSARLLARASAIGLFCEEGDAGDGYVARSPALVQLVADTINAGLSPTAALELAAAVVSAARQAGEAAAATVAAAAQAGVGNVDPLVRRGRVLLARAVASHTVDQVARHLGAHTEAIPELEPLLARIRIGTIATPPTTTDIQRGPRR